MLTNEHVSAKFFGSGQAEAVAALFLLGVASQILITAINKTAMWVCYFTAEEEGCTSWWAGAASWLSRQYWIDLLIDLFSLAAFGAATWFAFRIIVGT
jgi:hypothetical protein